MLGSDVLMLSDSVWLMVGERSPGERSSAAFVERTDDAGRSWSSILTLPRSRLWWIGRDGGEVLAAGGRLGAEDTAGEGQEDERPLLLRSEDGGKSFATTYPRVEGGISSWRVMATFAFSGHGAAIAVPREAPATAFGRGVLRSGDDGRAWHWAHLPGGGTADYGVNWTPDGRVAYATGETCKGRRCVGALWSSADAGARWQLLTSGHLEGPYGVAFTNRRHGFLSGGPDPRRSRGQVVYATDDGGRRWHVSWRESGHGVGLPLVALQFLDPSHGWALSAYKSPSSSVYDEGDAIVTTDGGRQWRDTGQPAGSLSALPDGSALALLRREGEPGEVELALTRNWGGSWVQLTPPADVLTDALMGGPGLLTELTDAGGFQSTDGGRTWLRFDPRQVRLSRTLLTVTPAITATLETSKERCALLLSRDRGRTWSTDAEPGGTLRVVRVPSEDAIPCITQAMAFATPQDGIAGSYSGEGRCPGSEPQIVYLTSDGGADWRRVCLPGLEGGESSVAASASTYTVLTKSSEEARIAISLDAGRTWSVRSLPHGHSCSGVAVYLREVWVVCAGEHRNFAYHSRDGGASWQEYVGGPGSYEGLKRDTFQPGTIVALGQGEAVLSDAGYYEGTGDGSLWRTTDGGASWTQEWPRLPIGPGSQPIVR
jgi:hypothetical protein